MAALQLLGGITLGFLLIAGFTPLVNLWAYWLAPSHPGTDAEPPQAIVVLGGGGVTATGVLTDASLRGAFEGITLSIPERAKPGLYARMRAVVHAERLPVALAAAGALAIAVNFVELLCTAGFPAMFTAILTEQDLAPLAHYGYIGLYIVGYMADDSLMVATAVIALSSRKLTEHAGRWLKLLSGAVMLALGFVMLLRPGWLL